MKIVLMRALYSISAFLNDIAFFVFGNEAEDIGISVKTLWSEHIY